MELQRCGHAAIGRHKEWLGIRKIDGQRNSGYLRNRVAGDVNEGCKGLRSIYPAPINRCLEGAHWKKWTEGSGCTSTTP